MMRSARLASVVYSRPSEVTVPSTVPATPPACTRMRSPPRNGRALSRTVPAMRLPTVCCAARPRITAVIAPPTASVWGLSPARRSAASTVMASVASRIRKPTVPAVPGSSRFSSVGPIAGPRFMAKAQPRITRAMTHTIRIGRSSPKSRWRYEYASTTAAISGSSSATWARARFARATACVRSCLTTPACIAGSRPVPFLGRQPAKTSWRLLRGGLGECRDLAELGEAGERLVLDPPHALGREAELPAGLSERRRLVPVDAVAQLDHPALLLGQLVERGAHGLVAQADLHLLVGLALLAREQVAELGVALLSHRPLEARDRAHHLARLVQLLDRELGGRGYLLVGRRTPVLRRQVAFHAGDLALALADVDRDPDGAPLVREATLDRLPDPEGGVGRELVSPAPVELLGRPDQAQDALLDQVEQCELVALVLLGERDDEAQVRVDHALLGLEVAALDSLRQLDLLLGREQRVAAHVAQEELQRVARHDHELVVVVGRAGRGAVAAVVLYLDPARLHPLVERLGLVVGQLELLCELQELGQVHAAPLLAAFHERLDSALGGFVRNSRHVMRSTPGRKAENEPTAGRDMMRAALGVPRPGGLGSSGRTGRG